MVYCLIIMIFDINFFGIDGFEVVWCICWISDMFVIMFFVFVEELDVVFGFIFGVDEYFVKLFCLWEL